MTTRSARLAIVSENDTFTNDLCAHFPHLLTQPSIKYNLTSISPITHPVLADTPTKFTFHPTDTISCAQTLVKTGALNPLVLNFASHKKPGGGYLNGSSAQEEALFYVSTYGLQASSRFYPLTDEECVYTPDVVVYREPVSMKVLDWPDCWQASFLALPALNRREYTGTPYTVSEHKLMTSKVRMLCEVALKHKHDSLLLGAWGSGVFGNDPQEVARIFETVLSSTEYKNRFKAVAFAVAGGPAINSEVYEALCE